MDIDTVSPIIETGNPTLRRVAGRGLVRTGRAIWWVLVQLFTVVGFFFGVLTDVLMRPYPRERSRISRRYLDYSDQIVKIEGHEHRADHHRY